jgi:hypothetical protein
MYYEDFNSQSLNFRKPLYYGNPTVMDDVFQSSLWARNGLIAFLSLFPLFLTLSIPKDLPPGPISSRYNENNSQDIVVTKMIEELSLKNLTATTATVGQEVAKTPEIDSHDFFHLKRSFHQSAFKKGLALHRLREIEKKSLNRLLLNAAPPKLRPSMRKYINWSLEIAADFQIDPLWMLSIMWTESHFRHDALSPAGARGLMQVIPETLHFARQQIGEEKFKRIKKKGKNYVNMYLGAYYLSYLFHKFNGNYVYATVGYNMGPFWVVKRRLENGPVGVKNKYLEKVKEAYSTLAQPLHQIFAKVTEPYKMTLAYRTVYKTNPYWRHRWLEFSQLLQSVPKSGPAVKTDGPYLISKSSTHSNSHNFDLQLSHKLVQF